MLYVIQDAVTHFYTDKAKPLKINRMINFNLHGEDKKSAISLSVKYLREKLKA